MLQPYDFDDHILQQQPQEEEQPISTKLKKVLFLKDICGVLLWFVISLNVSLFSRNSDNRNWAYVALFLIKGTTTSMAVMRGGKEGTAQSIGTTVASIAGTIAGNL